MSKKNEAAAVVVEENKAAAESDLDGLAKMEQAFDTASEAPTTEVLTPMQPQKKPYWPVNHTP